MALNGFLISGVVTLVPSNTSSSVALPGDPATALVTNTGSAIAYIALGGAGVTVNGPALALLPGTSVALTATGSTNLAAVGQGSVLNIAVGT